MEFNKKCFVVLLIFARRWNRINFATLKSCKNCPSILQSKCQILAVKFLILKVLETEGGHTLSNPDLNVPNFVLLHTVIKTEPHKTNY